VKQLRKSQSDFKPLMISKSLNKACLLLIEPIQTNLIVFEPMPEILKLHKSVYDFIDGLTTHDFAAIDINIAVVSNKSNLLAVEEFEAYISTVELHNETTAFETFFWTSNIAKTYFNGFGTAETQARQDVQDRDRSASWTSLSISLKESMIRRESPCRFNEMTFRMKAVSYAFNELFKLA